MRPPTMRQTYRSSLMFISVSLLTPSPSRLRSPAQARPIDRHLQQYLQLYEYIKDEHYKLTVAIGSFGHLQQCMKYHSRSETEAQQRHRPLTVLPSQEYIGQVMTNFNGTIYAHIPWIVDHIRCGEQRHRPGDGGHQACGNFFCEKFGKILHAPASAVCMSVC